MDQQFISASNSKSNQFTAQEKGKGKQRRLDGPGSESEWDESSDEEEFQDYNKARDTSSNTDMNATSSLTTWDSILEARAKAMTRSKLEPIHFPVIGDLFPSAHDYRIALAAHAIQNGFSSTTRRSTRNKSIQISCSISNTRSFRGAKTSCLWGCRGRMLESGIIEIYFTNSKHDHEVGEQLKESKKQGKSKSAEQANIAANARDLIKNSNGPILQNMTLSFATATEMRTHILAFAIQEKFAILHKRECGMDSFAIKCYLGKGACLLQDVPCSYKFRSRLDPLTKQWIVADSHLIHNHEMGLYELVGFRNQITEKGIKQKLEVQNFRLDEGKILEESDEADETEYDEGDEVNETESEGKSFNQSTARTRSRPEEENRSFKKAKITQMDLPRSQSITYNYQKFSRPQVPTTPAIPTPSVTPTPNLRIESAPEWINSLTKLLTAIDSRLSNLASVFDNAGIQNERAVMEMMHLSDDGLERLALKLAESGGRMTMMQKVYFKKGIVKIREEVMK